MNKIKKALSLGVILIGLAAIIYIRFSNPDMTETQLLIKYWFEFLVAVVLVIFGWDKLND